MISNVLLALCLICLIPIITVLQTLNFCLTIVQRTFTQRNITFKELFEENSKYLQQVLNNEEN